MVGPLRISIQLSLLPPRRRQRLRTARLTRRIQRLDSRAISLFVRMVIALGHRHRLMAGEGMTVTEISRATLDQAQRSGSFTAAETRPEIYAASTLVEEPERSQIT